MISTTTKITGHSSTQVIKNFQNPPRTVEGPRYYKKVILSEDSPLKKSGIDRFELMEFPGRGKVIGVYNNKNKMVADCHFAYPDDVEGMRNFFKAIKKLKSHINV